MGTLGHQALQSPVVKAGNEVSIRQRAFPNCVIGVQLRRFRIYRFAKGKDDHQSLDCINDMAWEAESRIAEKTHQSRRESPATG